jgi:hypothetical protein
MCCGLHNRPHNKIVSAPVISTRSINARSRMNCIAQIKNNASKGIRFTRVIVVFNASLQPSHSNPAASYCCQPPPRFALFIFCMVSLFPSVVGSVSAGCVIKLERPPHLASAFSAHPHVRYSIGEPGNTQQQQFLAAGPAGVRNRQSRRVVFPAAPVRNGLEGRAQQ